MTVVARPARSGYDVIVVGGGPAGVTLAKKLAELTDLRVLIVESGVEDVGVAQELAKVQAAGDLRPDYYAAHSQRLFGGTSNIWHGWCAVLDERPFLGNEWPFPYGELKGYYPEAARILNVPSIVHERPEAVLDMDRSRTIHTLESDVPHAERVAHGVGLSSSFSNERSVLSATVILVEPSPVQALLAARRLPAFHTQITVRAEMAPTEDNNVELSNTEKDHLGQPRARVAMRFDLAAVEKVLKLLNAELVRAGIGRFQFRSGKPSFVYKRGVPFVNGGGHLMGTTRMGEDPSRSVTDAAGRVHGFSNLYVAGSSLFPASSAANPTLTIVALALRLAEHLATQAR